MGLTLRTRILLLFLGLGLVPLVGVGLASYANSIRTVEAVVAERAGQAVGAGRADLERVLGARRGEFGLLARGQEVQDLYARQAAGGRGSVALEETEISGFLAQFTAGPRVAFVGVHYLDLAGNQILAWTRSTSAGFGQEAYGLAHTDPTFRPPDLRPYDEDRLHLATVPSAAYGPLLRLSRLVVDPVTGQRRGFVVADVQVSALLRDTPLTRSTGPGELLVLVDRGGHQLLHHPQASLVGRSLDEALPGLTPVSERMRQKQTEHGRYREGKEEWLVSQQDLADPAWTLVALGATYELTAPVRRAGLVNLGITLCVLVLAVVLLPAMLRRVTASIRRVADGAAAIAAGHLDQEIEVTAWDETGVLATSFNRMARSLKATLGDLRRLNAELEDRVRRRTAQLEEAGQRLEAQNRGLAVESAVERVRAEALSMRSSQDLRRVAAVMWHEMVKLGIDTPGCTFQFLDEAAGRLGYYLALASPGRDQSTWTSQDLVELDRDTVVYSEDLTLEEFVSRVGPGYPFGGFLQRWRAGKPWCVAIDEEWTQAESAAFSRRFGDGQPWPDRPGPWVVTNVPFEYGTVGFREKDSSAEHVSMVGQLTQALSVGYLRFLDFQRLEAQNRALEEVNVRIQEATRQKSTFLARMSHDLRTPMNAIIGYTRILLRKTSDQLDERQYRNLQNIQVSADHLLRLVNDILDLSRVEAGRVDLHPEPVDLAQLVGECAASVSSLVRPGVELVQRLEPVPLLTTDPDRVRRVVMNLLSNAVKFTQQGCITLTLAAADGGVELAVADTGVGIPEEDLPHIFEEFRQSRHDGGVQTQGSGLGLAIARKSAELLGGTLCVESRVGQGSTFTVRLTDYPSQTGA